MFSSIQDFKDRAEFFPAGKIIPQRILKGPRKFKSNIRFDCRSWAMRTDFGYVIAAELASSQHGDCVISIKHTKNAHLKGSPYYPKSDGKGTIWIGDGRGVDEQLRLLNLVVSKRLAR